MSSFIENSSSNDEANDEPVGLLSLSINAISLILSSFLRIHDISRLDVAYCNHNKRQHLLYILNDNPYITYDHVIFTRDFKYINNAIQWIGLRGINILALGGDYSSNKYLTSIGLIGLSRHCTSLTCLDIRECVRVNDSGIIAIARNCLNLISFNANGTMITDDSIIELAIHSKSLLTLNISGCEELTTDGMIYLARHCTSLTSLDICNNSNAVNDVVVTEIARHCTSLTSLDICFNHNITDISINELARHCINLITLDITACHNITDHCRTEACLLLPNLKLGDIFRESITLLWADNE